MLGCSYGVCKLPKINLLTVSHMTPTEIVVFSCVIGAVLGLSTLITLNLQSRLNYLRDKIDNELVNMAAQATPKQLESANAAAQSAQAIVQTSVQEIAKFKDQIHSEMQRFYAIMSRNEKAVKKQEANLPPSSDASEVPEEIDASAFNPEPPPGHEISKSDLRALARKAGL